MKSIAKLLVALLAVGCLVALIPGAAFAAEVRSGPTPLVAPNETIDDDLFAGGGQIVTISGRVTGDAYAIAETVVVNGAVDGDLIAGAQQVIVDGTVNGNVRAAGATVTINGTVGRSVTSASQHLNVTSNARIGGSVVAAGQNLDVFGQVGRGMTVGGGTLQVAGSVGGPVLAHLETLSVAPTAHLAGNLDYQANQEAPLPAGAVGGTVQFHPAPQRAPQPTPFLNGLFGLGGLIGLVGSFLLGAISIMLMPRAVARAAELGRQQPWQSFGLGLLVLICAPIVALVVAVTLIGLPIALAMVALYLTGILVAWPLVGLVLGTQLARLARPAQPLPVLANLAVGLIVLHLLTHVPFIGPLVVFCSVVFGLGLIVQAVRRWRRPVDLPRTVPPFATATAA
jgi:cytoskeletal protein CcmA (bactofilin family)